MNWLAIFTGLFTWERFVRNGKFIAGGGGGVVSKQDSEMLLWLEDEYSLDCWEYPFTALRSCYLSTSIFSTLLFPSRFFS